MTSSTSVRIDGRCPTVAALDATDFPTLAAQTADIRAETGRLGCELVVGHDGAHVALVATAHDGDQWWWLRWNREFCEVVQVDPCPAELPPEPHGDCCTLPGGHHGPHSYDLPPITPSPQ